MKRELKGLLKRGIEQSTQRPNDPIEKIMLSSAGYAKQPRAAEIDALSAAVAEAAKPLLGLAMSGNVHAIRRVTDVASNLCSEAMMLACMHQDAANAVARDRTSWPLNISTDPAERRRALRLITGARRLPLSEAAPKLRKINRAPGFTSPANAAVLVAMKAIQIERAFRVPSEFFPVLQPEWSSAAARLPDFDGTNAVADQWFNVIWMYLCHRHGGEPENSALRKLAARDAAPARANAAHEPLLRAEIRLSVRKAFDRLVKSDQSKHSVLAGSQA